MMMKTMKLMMATALATATLVGTFIESAEAVSRGKGNEPSGSRTNQLDVNYEFELFTITPTGKPRTDEDDNSKNNIGIFTGAIEEFKGRISDIGGKFEFDEVIIARPDLIDGGANFDPLEENGQELIIDSPLTLDLTAKLISAGSSILLPNGTPAINIFGGNNLSADEDRIEYTLTGNALEDRGISELTLIIAGLGDINDPIQAVNSIEYIIDKQLLGKVNNIRVSAISSFESSKIYSDESTVSRPSTSKRIDDRVVEVPESSTTNSLLALGFLAVGSLLRRKMKESNRIQL
jgi:hypothetical protein